MGHGLKPTFYASGTNHGGEIRGFRSCKNSHVGCVARFVAADTPSGRVLRKQLRRFPRQVFIDSGAINEVDKNLKVKKPMTAEDWQMVFRAYNMLLDEGLAGRLTVVAPDRVGCQDETFRRLRTYAEDVRALQKRGARVLVALQRGAIDTVAFWDEVNSMFPGCTPAFPMRYGATSPEEVAAFYERRTPPDVHLLGIGLDTPRGKAALDAIPVGVKTSADSCLIKRSVGRGPCGKKPRKLTRARDFWDPFISSVEPNDWYRVFMVKRFSFESTFWDFWDKIPTMPAPEPWQMEFGFEY